MLDWALETLSGDVAADARSEGPSCVLSAVDTRQDKRLRSAGLDHDPRPEESAACVRRVPQALAERHVALQGSTTEGSARSPAPLRTVCGEVPHQRCPFPGITARTHGGVTAVATARARVATSTPTVPRGRPSSTDKDARRLARQSTSLHQHISEGFQERCVCVTRRLTPSERPRLLSITRGLPHRRTRRERMEDSDALCARRCHPQTALGTLQHLRQWVRRCTWMGETGKKVCSPRRDHALTWLDDTWLPATSNAVERGHRRHRKRHKRVYRVRSTVCGEGRIALDRLRASRAEGRDHTTQALPKARRGYT